MNEYFRCKNCGVRAFGQTESEVCLKCSKKISLFNIIDALDTINECLKDVEVFNSMILKGLDSINKRIDKLEKKVGDALSII